LAGELSAPVRVEALDIFPPEAPTGLAAVATTGENGAAPAIDLSWQPVADPNLAGYIVYRSEKGGEREAAWQRISPAGPLVPPAFHDTQVQPGHTYRYAVSAIGQNGHESFRSAEAEETVPNP
jgi:fibronectin type 3 domain-containing protein